MLRTLSDLQDCAIDATDGPIGHVKDFYFDDHAWAIRYLVVHTGAWLAGRTVLISPISIGAPDWDGRLLPVSITKDQVRNSPDIDTDKPVSRQHEESYFGYYGYPYYWGGLGMWGEGYYPSMLADGRTAEAEQSRDDRAAGIHAHADPHLRSCKAIMGYHIEATDGDIGQVKGLLVDEETWAVRYMIVDTSSWWFGHQVLIAPQWIKSLRWDERTVAVALSREAVKDSPSYDPATLPDRSAESSLYAHYGRVGYWPTEGHRSTRP